MRLLKVLQSISVNMIFILNPLLIHL
jgi:hypothetical protein